MKKLSRACVVAAFACIGLAVPTAAYAGPLYGYENVPLQYIWGTVGGNRVACEAMVASAQDSSTGQFYALTSGSSLCAYANVELVYIDNSGVERVMRASADSEMDWTPQSGEFKIEDDITNIPGAYPELQINRSNYRQILEVVGTVNSAWGSRTCYLFYNPNWTSCQ